MGLRKCTCTTPLLSGLSVFPICVSILFGALKLLKSCLECNSSVSLFYKMLLKRQNRVVTEQLLLGRVWSFLSKNDVSFNSYLINNEVIMPQLKHLYYVPYGIDGITDL